MPGLTRHPDKIRRSYRYRLWIPDQVRNDELNLFSKSSDVISKHCSSSYPFQDFDDARQGNQRKVTKTRQ